MAGWPMRVTCLILVLGGPHGTHMGVQQQRILFWTDLTFLGLGRASIPCPFCPPLWPPQSRCQQRGRVGGPHGGPDVGSVLPGDQPRAPAVGSGGDPHRVSNGTMATIATGPLPALDHSRVFNECCWTRTSGSRKDEVILRTHPGQAAGGIGPGAGEE
eukprot:jgi/Botrbrau1/2395/Bobra.0395s0027.1